MSSASVERLVEILLIAAPAWPLLWLATEPGFFRRLRGLPTVAATLAAAVVAYVGGIVAVTLYVPMLLRPLALLGVAIVIGERWRARIAYGRARGLPPGSLGILPRAPLRDHRFFQKQAARHGPIFKTSQFLRPMVCVVGLPRGLDLLSRYDKLLQPPPLPFNQLIPGGDPRWMTAEQHAAFIPVLRAAFTRNVISACEPHVVACVRDELAQMAADGAAASTMGVSPRPYLARITRIAFARIFFGFAPGTEPLTRMLALGPRLDFSNLTRWGTRRALQALEEVSALIRTEAARLAALPNPADGTSPSFLATIVGNDPVAGRNLACNLAAIMENTAGDLSGLLNWLLRQLIDHPRWVEPLRAEVARGGTSAPDALATRVVLEALRLEQMEFIYRDVTQDLPLDGFVIPRGWQLRICVRESHRDPAIFPDPDAFNPDRFLGRSYTRTEYAPFGILGSYVVCLGEQLTKTVGRIFVSELAAGFDWRVLRDGPREFSGWHSAPSGRLRLQLTPRR
jgi:cytochrome P450